MAATSPSSRVRTILVIPPFRSDDAGATSIAPSRERQPRFRVLTGSPIDPGGPSREHRHLGTEIEADLLASGDIVLIRRIVSHLLGNAATHTPPGTTITVSCHRRNGEVVVVVADDGPGIAEDDLPFLGERFFRAGDVNARPRGLGLGLALALGILDLHGSTLVVENGTDGGARFSFSVPLVPDPSRSPSEGDAASPSAYAPHHGRA